MTIQSVFNTGLKIAIESSYSVAPAAGDYFQGGRWVDIVTDGLPDLLDRQAVIFPAGHAGRRAMNNRSPVVGRKWSGGNFAFPITSDFMGTVLYGLMGSASANSVPSTTFSLLADEPLVAGVAKQLVLTNQPSDGGAVLKFWVSGTSTAGSLSVQGIDANGNGASEILSWTSGGSLYTRTSFSAIGASSISITSNNTATVTVQGYKYFDYHFSLNNTSAPTIAIERYGDPTAGAASISRMHTGMVIQDLTLNSPAAQVDGLITGAITLEGNPTATCTAGTLNDTSAVGVWPSWGLKITRDNTNWFKVTDATLNVATGARTYRSAAGVQNPQGVFHGGFEATGAFQLLVDNEEEFLRWQGASKQAIRYLWTSPWRLTTADYQTLSASMLSAYIEGDINPQEDEQAWSLGVNIRAANNDSAGVISWDMKSNVPPTAYGL